MRAKYRLRPPFQQAGLWEHGNASVTWGENSKMARRSLSLQGFPGPFVLNGGRDSVEPPHETEALRSMSCKGVVCSCQ